MGIVIIVMKTMQGNTIAKKKCFFQIDVTFPTPSKEINLEETPEKEINDHNLITHEAMEPKVQQEETCISLHSLSFISSPQTLKI